MTFQELQLLPSILQAVEELGYERPSPIQAAAIPHVLAGRDLIGCAQTGTGKTAAFAIPILQRLQRPGRRRATSPVRALILDPYPGAGSANSGEFYPVWKISAST